MAKTDDFRLLTADFDGDRRTFEPWLSLRLMSRDSIVSYGVYRPAFHRDEADVEPPDVVWRRAEWDNARDAAQFEAASDKSAYLLGDTQIESCIRFGRLAEQPRLATALRKGVDLLSAGVHVVAMRREDVALENVRVCVFADKLVMNLDYAPWMARSGEVESWAERWSTLFDSLDDTGTVAPDGEITVSYGDSFGELLPGSTVLHGLWSRPSGRPTVTTDEREPELTATLSLCANGRATLRPATTLGTAVTPP